MLRLFFSTLAAFVYVGIVLLISPLLGFGPPKPEPIVAWEQVQCFAEAPVLNELTGETAVKTVGIRIQRPMTETQLQEFKASGDWMEDRPNVYSRVKWSGGVGVPAYTKCTTVELKSEPAFYPI